MYECFYVSVYVCMCVSMHVGMYVSHVYVPTQYTIRESTPNIITNTTSTKHSHRTKQRTDAIHTKARRTKPRTKQINQHNVRTKRTTQQQPHHNGPNATPNSGSANKSPNKTHNSSKTCGRLKPWRDTQTKQHIVNTTQTQPEHRQHTATNNLRTGVPNPNVFRTQQK